MAPTETSILRQISNITNSIRGLIPLSVHRAPPKCTRSPPRRCFARRTLHPVETSSTWALILLVVESISKKCDVRFEELRSSAETILHRACTDLALVPRPWKATPLPQLLQSLIAIHTARYLKSLGALEERVIAIASNLKPSCSEQPRRTSKRAERKPLKPFNREFIPFLEKYFEYNAFPSSADRAEMAKKSMMEPRQIEVWFQNHRRRAKEEGRNVRKLGPTDPAPLELCLKSMEEKMEPYLIPDGLRQSVDSEVSEAGSDDEEEDDDDFYNEKPEVVDLTNVLNPPAARHAYPVKFKESRNLASTILSTQEFSFPPPNWPRKAAVALPKRPVETMDDLLLSFAGLHIHDGRQVLSPPFQNATTIIPPTAPLPALVRAKARRHPFRSPSPHAQPATLVPAGASASVSPASQESRRAPAAYTDEEARAECKFQPPRREPRELRHLDTALRLPAVAHAFARVERLLTLAHTVLWLDGPATPSGSPSALPLEIVDLDRFGDFARIQQQYGYESSPVEEPEYPQHSKRQRRMQFGFEQYASQR
ncbi:Mating-type protein A-alpha Y1 [Mycena venus]|uniref:Mating-type protein A-alpha Y1 n=1 Tax=Mycena venus TaxID=2733690 RepID=A0A8H6XWQ5_9AGAR|nr:Mating-type protein A-alpha Y1 [Mycena venus]